jgi:Papain family cysteine protease
VIVGLRTTKAFLRLRRGEIYRNPDQFPIYHAITLVGYDERLQAFKLINSWGQGWADGGFGWIGYETLRVEAGAAYLARVALAPSPAPSAPPVPIVRLTPAPTPRPLSTVVPTPPTTKPTPIIGPAITPELTVGLACETRSRPQNFHQTPVPTRPDQIG